MKRYKTYSRTNKPRRVVNFQTTLVPARDNASPSRFNKGTEARNSRSHGTPASDSYYSRFMYILRAYKAAIALLKPGGDDAEARFPCGDESVGRLRTKCICTVFAKQTGTTLLPLLLHLRYWILRL